MKRFALVVAAVVVWSGIACAQFKSQVNDEHPSVTQSILRQDYNSFDLFGWFNPENFQMRHSFTMSYQTFGSTSLGVNMYTNSMLYKFSDRLNVAADVSLMMTPYGSVSPGVKNQFSGVMLNRAQINYKPWDNFLIQVQYRKYPYGYTDGYFGGYGSRFYNPLFGDGY